MQTIGLFVGTRPEAIKLAPVYLELRRSRRFRPLLVSTGQHREMLDQVFRCFDIRPDADLNVMVQNQTLAGLAASLFTSIDALLAERRLDAVMVQGDTTTAMIAALTAFQRRTPVVHVEAGLRSYDKWAPFPEEVNRQAISLVADVHFAPTEEARRVLKAEGRRGVHRVGNTVIDALLLVRKRVEETWDRYEGAWSERLAGSRHVVLITGHRRESFGRGLKQICTAIRTLAKAFPEVCYVYPVHLNPNVDGTVRRELRGLANVHLVAPVPYDELVYLMMRSHLILTDSGGIQEEAPTLGKPVIVLREKTERPEGVAAGCAVLGGTESARIVRAFRRIYLQPAVYRRMARSRNPYGDGRASQRIHTILRKELPRRRL